MGASVYILDHNLARLQELDRELHGHIVTMVSHSFNIEKVCRFADVLVGAVLVPGARTPILVSREMVSTMRPRSIIIDLSIDQGGCVETSRPTTHSNSTYLEEGVIHYCVPNMTGVIGRTATHAMANATWPFIRQIADIGLERSLEDNPMLRQGIYTHRGQIHQDALTDATKGRR
jgi:alanine dehydrogenase